MALVNRWIKVNDWSPDQPIPPNVPISKGGLTFGVLGDGINTNGILGNGIATNGVMGYNKVSKGSL
jgi:hypothetical protein